MAGEGKLKVGMVGLGLVARSHLKGYLAHPRAEVVAVCDLDEGNAQTFAHQHHVPQVYTSYDEMLAEGGIDLVDIGTPTFLHAPMALQAARAGKHLHFEEGGDEIWDSEISYYSQGHLNQVGHLLDCIVQDTPPRYTGEDEVHAVRCTLASIRSAQEGRPVRVDEIGPEYTAYT